MKIIVSGGAGFIGSHIVDRLVKDNHEVIVIDDLSTGRGEFINPKVRFIKADIVTSQLIDVFKGVDYVFHEAAIPRIQLSLEHPEKTFKANVYATQRVLQWSGKQGVKRVIYASSSSVYGKIDDLDNRRFLPLNEFMPCDPLSPYAAQKYMSEIVCKSYAFNFGLDIVALRYFNVYGERMSTTGVYKLVMAIWKEQMKAGKRLTVFGDGTQTRDFTYIDDVVNANILAMNTKSIGRDNFQVFNICSGEEISIIKVAKMMGGEISFVPNPREKWEEKRKVGSYDLANEMLGYKPKVLIKQGLERYL